MAVYLRRIIQVGIIFSFVLSLSSPAAVKADSPVEISTPAQLNNIRGNLSGSYILTADIDLSAISNWVPLGTSASPFVGDLDGNGHIIRNLLIANTQSSDLGLFGVIGSTGLVSNLQVLNANVTAADNAGILAGSNQGTISRVLTHGIISGANTVGGLVGSNSGTISYAYTQAEVSGRNMNGGLVGNNSGSIDQSYAASQVSKAVTNNYVQFDGTDDYISIPHNPAYITDSFTLEAWFQWTATDRTSVSFITGKGLENFEIHTGGGSGANGIRFIPVVRDDTTYNDSRAYQDVPNVLQPGWNHVAAVWDYANQQVRVFLNGLPQDIYQIGVNVGPVANLPLDHPETNPLALNEEEFFIGARNDQYYGYPSLFFKGNIADVRFWNTVRTPSQIASDKYKQLTGTESGLIGYWKLDEASGNTVEDSSSLHNDGTLLGNAVRVQEVSVNGGLVAVNTGSVTASYYDSDLSGLSDSDKGTPLSTEFMKRNTSYADWDFIGTWQMLEDQTYPSLFDLSVTLEQDSAQSDPTNESAVDFRVVFAEPIAPATFTAEDITLGGSAGPTTAAITQVAPNDGTTFNIAVGGMTTDGTVTAAIAAGRVADLVGNLNTASQSTDNSVAYDGTTPLVTLEQDVAQSDPTNESDIDFRVVFTEPISTYAFTDEDITLGGTAGATTAVITEVEPYNDMTFNVAVSGMAFDGTVTAFIAAGQVSDAIGNLNEASQSTDNSVTYDGSSPTVTLEQDSAQSDPTNESAVDFRVVFVEPIAPASFTAEDVTLGGTAGATTAVITQVAPNNGTTFNIAVSGMTADGTVTASIAAGQVADAVGNLNEASQSTDNSVAYDGSSPTVTLEQDVAQSDPTNELAVDFRVVFVEPIAPATFTAEDVTLGGTAGATTAAITQVAPNDGTTFNVAVSGMTANGTVTASIAAGRVADLAGNLNEASVSTDNSVSYDASQLTVSLEQSSTQRDPTNTIPIHFTAIFSKPILLTSFTAADIVLGGTAGADTVAIAELAPNDGTTFDLSVSGLTGTGTVTAAIPADGVSDPAGNLNAASAGVDTTVTMETTRPDVTVNQADGQADPTNTQPIHFVAVFSEPILTTTFTAADVVISGGSGSESVLISEVAPNDGTTFDLAVSGLVDSRDISVSISELGVADLADNLSRASSSTDNSVRYDVSELSASVEQAVGQTDPTNQSTIHMTLTFNKPITPTTLTVDDITLGGSAGATTVTLTEMAPFDGTVFDLQISGMTANGTVTATLPAERVTDPAGNANLISTSVDNLVAYDVSNPIMSQISLKAVYVQTGPQEFEIQFNKAMYNPDDSLNDPDDVNNPANYLLISAGTNRQFDTLTCAGGLLPDDNRVEIVDVVHDEDSFTSTIRLAAALPIGSYRLFVCGTTSLLDAAMNHLNGGTDTIFNFSVNAGQNLPSSKTNLPATGFAQNQVTVLPNQPFAAHYADSGQVLVIPSLNVRAEIVGVPLVNDTWDVTWLNQRAGYLYGSAYPTLSGNTVITGHVWDADNTPGIFADLKSLKYGDEIQIMANGQVYTYAVRENSRVNASDLTEIFTDEEYDWVTLVTCEGYDSDANAYPYRRMVRAVLIKVE